MYGGLEEWGKTKGRSDGDGKNHDRFKVCNVRSSLEEVKRHFKPP